MCVPAEVALRRLEEEESRYDDWCQEILNSSESILDESFVPARLFIAEMDKEEKEYYEKMLEDEDCEGLETLLSSFSSWLAKKERGRNNGA